MQRITIFIVCLSQLRTYAQVNLVLNPSFEEYSSCPVSELDFWKATFWSSPTDNTPNYFNACNTLPFPSDWSVPHNWENGPNPGFQYARSGVAYGGGYIKGDQNGREYLQGKLIEPLKADSNYAVEAWLSLSNFSRLAVKDIGIYLSVDSVYYPTLGLLPLVPQIVNQDSFLSDTLNWMRIGGSYKATGGEHFIIIGLFTPDSVAIIDTLDTLNGGDAYYYVDDVSVIELKDTVPPISNTCELSVPTLISNEQWVITTTATTMQVVVYNVLGQQLFYSANYQNDWVPPASGIYFYKLQCSNGDMKKGKVVAVK